MYIKKVIILFYLTFYSTLFYGSNISNYFKNLKAYNYKIAYKEASKISNSNLKKHAFSLIKVLENPYEITIDSIPIDKFSKYQKTLFYIRKGYTALYKDVDLSNAFLYINKALSILEDQNNEEAKKFCLITKLKIYNYQIIQTNIEQKELLTLFKSKISDNFDKFHYLNLFFEFNLRKIDLKYRVDRKYINEFRQVMSFINKKSPLWCIYHSTMGIYLGEDEEDKALEHFMASNRMSKNILFLKKIKFKNSIHLSHIYKSKKNFKEALEHLNIAEHFYNKRDSLKIKYFINKYRSDIYYDSKQYKLAHEYISKTININERLNYLKNNIEISNLKEKYQTEKKEKENLQLKQDNLETEAKRKQNLNFLIASLLFILLGGTIGILSLKNSKRKRKLAEQEKELETQKNLTLIKEQELTTINAMVEGQEKERKRVAEDLHDNLGSVLATLKLHFENLKINNKKKKIDQETLFNKTESLIDEAYLKVRSIAHAKNAGVIANQGLLTAVKMMAEKISSADKIKIEVIDFGLHERVENSLEISVFRIIQELVTNIIKHAEAKNATINISLYDKNLNIIIEDDGKGFDIKKVNLKNGMGINSIKTRIAHLKGTFEIDATIGKGSSVIIDIPVE